MEKVSRQVNEARREYEQARVEAERAIEQAFCDTTREELDALREAHRRESASLDEFMRLLRILHGFVAEGEKRGHH